MPLSDEEARLLQQLEQSLAAEDPDFASTLRGSKQRARNRRVAIIAGLGFVVGIAVMFTGAVQASTPLGIVGFLLMLVGAYFAVTAWRGGLGREDSSPSPRSGGSGSGSTGKKSSTSFVDRMEERWQRRRGEDGGF